MKNLLQGKTHPTSCHSEMMTEPAELAKRSKLNMVIRLFACQCSLWRLKQAELKYQTRGEIACNSYDGKMSLEHVQDLSFCGAFPIFSQHPQSLSLSPAATAGILGHCGSVKCGGVVCSPGVAHTSTALHAGGSHVEMSSCHCCFQLVARANSTLHPFKQENCVKLP